MRAFDCVPAMHSERINLDVSAGASKSHMGIKLSGLHPSGGASQWIFVYSQGQVPALASVHSVWQFLLLGL